MLNTNSIRITNETYILIHSTPCPSLSNKYILLIYKSLLLKITEKKEWKRDSKNDKKSCDEKF